jgi:hypothetical protein
MFEQSGISCTATVLSRKDPGKMSRVGNETVEIGQAARVMRTGRPCRFVTINPVVDVLFLP